MDKFTALPQERQQGIATAAMRIFGAVGYRKAYISDIAAEAGISKALVFHYFGSKKALYLYLIEYTGKIMVSEFQQHKGDDESADFFDRISQSARIKLAVMNHHPALMSFLNSMYHEDDEEVAVEIRELLSQSKDVRSELVFNGADTHKLKEGVDPDLVVNFLLKFIEGVLGSRLDNTRSIEEIELEFTQCLTMLKNNLYREEYLS